MKNTSYVCLGILIAFGLCSFSGSVNQKSKNLVSYPLTGKFKFVNSPMIEYKQIYFWVYNHKGIEVYFTNHSIGTAAAQETPNLSNMIDSDYKTLMVKNGNKLRERNFKNIQ